MVLPDAPPRLELRFSDENIPRERDSERSAQTDATLHAGTDVLHTSAKQVVDKPTQHHVALPMAPVAPIAASPPDGGKTAWIQVLASFLINMNVYGLVNAFGDFQHFYETEYLSEYSSSTISWIGTVQGALTLIIATLSGPIFDKGYFMLTLRVASALLVFSWMMLSLSSQYYQVGDIV